MRFHIHRRRLMFCALFGLRLDDGYAVCRRCGSRSVNGPDRYGPYAWAWIHDGTAPPESR